MSTYRRGYIHLVIRPDDDTYKKVIDAASGECDELVVGLPSKWTYARIFNMDSDYDPEVLKEDLMGLSCVIKVLILEPSEVGFEKESKASGCDVYYYGIEYGSLFEKDLKQAEDANVVMRDIKLLDGITPDEISPDSKRQLYAISLDEPEGWGYKHLKALDVVALMDEAGPVFKSEQAYIDKSQRLLTDLLVFYDDICRKIGVKYYLICGSLLGALRHKGYIPWDDDLDIAMTRDDYNKLRDYMLAHQKDDDRFRFVDFWDVGTGGFHDCMPRIVDYSEIVEKKVMDGIGIGGPATDCCNHSGVDIYVMDSAYDGVRKHNMHMLLLKVIYNMAMGHRKNIDYNHYARMGKKILLAMKILNTFGKMFSLRTVLNMYEKVSQWANHKGTECYYMNSCAITCIERKFEKKWFTKALDVPFEDMTIMIPNGYDELMNAMGYHNYMEFPPYSVMHSSHYITSDVEIW